MGKLIDRFALFALCAAAFYIFFLNAWHSIPLACLLAFLCCALLRPVLRNRPSRWRCSIAQAEVELLRIAELPEPEAEPLLRRLILQKYPDTSFCLATLLKHPSASISTGDVFSVWKAHRNEDALVIAATGTADARALMYAQELTAPRVALIDRRILLRIIRETGMCASAPTPTPLGKRLRRFWANLSARHIGPKNALFGLTLLGMYLLVGNPLYLVLSMAILFWFGISLFNTRTRQKLFR